MRDKKRTFLSLPPKIAPIKCSILPLISSEKFEATIQNLKVNLNKVGVSSKVDDSGNSIGKRYARTDELGIPFGITIDPETLEDKSVTLREILTCKQIRIPVKKNNK
jgi:glycyl-tRNA synthetase